MSFAGCALGAEYIKKKYPNGQPFRGPWKTMEPNKIDAAIIEHKKWLAGTGGSRLSLRRVRIQDYDFGEADLRRAIFKECAILRCNMAHVDIRQAEFPDSAPVHTHIKYDNGAVMDASWDTYNELVIGKPMRKAAPKAREINERMGYREWADTYSGKQKKGGEEVNVIETEASPKTEAVNLEVIEDAPLPVQLTDMTIERLRDTAESYRSLKVTGKGRERKKSFADVKRAHIDGKSIVSRVKTRTTDLRRPILAKAKEISDVGKMALEIIEPVVGHLADERVTEEARVRKIMERKVAAEQHRIATVRHEIDSRKAGWTDAIVHAESSKMVDAAYIEIRAYEIDPLFFEEFTEEMQIAVLTAAKSANSAYSSMLLKEQAEAARKAEAVRIAEENRIKAEALEKQEAELKARQEAAEAEIARKQAVEAKRLEDERQAFAEQQAKAEAARKAKEEKAEAIRKAEAEALRKKQAEMDAREAALREHERQAAEKKTREEAEANAKMEAEEQEKRDAEQRIKDHIEAMGINQQIDDERVRLAEEDAKAEAVEMARREALKPDKLKIAEFIGTLHNLDYPDMVTDEGISWIEEFKGELGDFLEEAANTAASL